MAAILRTAAPDIAKTIVGAALAWPAGRVATGLCDFETSLCRTHAGATWIWLVFTAALLLAGTGIWRLATLRRRLDAPAVESRSAPVTVPDAIVARRLAAVAQPRDDMPLAAPATAPAPVQTAVIEDKPSDAIDEFVWLKAQPAMSRAFIAANWNWDYDLAMLKWLVEQPDCDGGIAAGVCWRALRDTRPLEAANLSDIGRSVAHRFERGRVAVDFAFDDEGVEDLYAAAVDAFTAGKIGWNPAFLPVRSSGTALTIDDLPRSARPAVVAFLHHIGSGAISSA